MTTVDVEELIAERAGADWFRPAAIMSPQTWGSYEIQRLFNQGRLERRRVTPVKPSDPRFEYRLREPSDGR